MASRLYLHIGTMKSATTYLQALLDDNPGPLEELGLAWLGSPANFSAIADFYDDGDSTRERSILWPEFKKAISDHDGHVVVSNELLAARRTSRLAALVEAVGCADNRMVITARDLGRTIPSQWQERARHRPMSSWSDFLAALTAPGSRQDPQLGWFWRRQDLDVIVRQAVDVVGADRVTVVTVPPAGSAPGLVGERFFAALDRAQLPPLVQPPPLRENQAMGARSVELIRRVQERIDPDDRERLRVVLKQVLSRRVLTERRGEPPIVLGHDELAWARETATAMTERVRDQGVRVVGDLVELVPEDRDPAAPLAPGEGPDSTTEAQLLDVAVDALVAMADALEELSTHLAGTDAGEQLRLLGQRSLPGQQPGGVEG